MKKIIKDIEAYKGCIYNYNNIKDKIKFIQKSLINLICKDCMK